MSGAADTGGMLCHERPLAHMRTGPDLEIGAGPSGPASTGVPVAVGKPSPQPQEDSMHMSHEAALACYALRDRLDTSSLQVEELARGWRTALAPHAGTHDMKVSAHHAASDAAATRPIPGPQP